MRAIAWNVVFTIATAGLLTSANAQARVPVGEWSSRAVSGALLSAIWADSMAYALDSRNNVVLVFSADGDSVGSFGGRDEPGGALQAPVAIGMEGTRLWVHDLAKNKTLVYSADGEQFRALSVPRVDDRSDEHFFVVRALAASGSMLLEENVPSAYVDAMMRNGRIVVQVPQSGVPDTATLLAQNNAVMLLRIPTGGVSMRGQPWAHIDLFGVSSNGGVRVTARQVPGRPTTVQWDGLGGDAPVTRDIPNARRPVSDQDVESAIDDVLAAGLQARYVDPQDARRAVREALFVPGTAPHAKSLLVANSGVVWLERHTDGRCQYWDILSPSSAVQITNVCMPLGARLMDVGDDWALAVVPDPPAMRAAHTSYVRLVRFSAATGAQRQ